MGVAMPVAEPPPDTEQVPMLAIEGVPTSAANPGGSTMTQPFGAFRVEGVPVQRLVPE